MGIISNEIVIESYVKTINHFGHLIVEQRFVFAMITQTNLYDLNVIRISDPSWSAVSRFMALCEQVQVQLARQPDDRLIISAQA